MSFILYKLTWYFYAQQQWQNYFLNGNNSADVRVNATNLCNRREVLFFGWVCFAVFRIRWSRNLIFVRGGVYAVTESRVILC